MFRRGFLAAFLLTWLAPASLFGARFNATIDHHAIRLGENTTLSLICEGGTPEQELSLPHIPNLQIQYIGPSSQFSVINGQVSSSVTYKYSVTPIQIGEFIIPAVSAIIGDQRLTTQPIKLTVTKPEAPPASAAGADPAFLRLVVPKQRVFVGETFVAELRLYLSASVQNFGNFQITSMPADGFTVGKSAQGPRRTVRIGNAIYTEIPLQFALTAIKSGPLNLGPITASMVVELPSGNRRRDPIWDPFGVLGTSEQRALAISSDTNSVECLPLPGSAAPGNYNGAIGDYEMTVSAGPTNVAVGDPITVKVQIAGHGSLDPLTLPDQPAWKDFKIYPSPPKIETTDTLGLTGTKTFEQVVVPQNAEIRQLPPVTFSYFDVESGVYRTLTGPEIKLAVRSAGAAATPVIAANALKESNPLPAQDIVSIKQRPGSLAEIAPPLVQQPWFLALQSLPAVAWAGALLWRKRTDQLARNPRLRRRRHVAQIIRDGINDLRRFAGENRSDDFFATLFRLLQEQLGERLDLPASAITEAVIADRLRPGGVPEPLLAEVHELFQTCNLARYAPIKTSQELAAFIPKIEVVLRQLREVKA